MQVSEIDARAYLADKLELQFLEALDQRGEIVVFFRIGPGDVNRVTVASGARVDQD